jgi:hypothetical protein
VLERIALTNSVIRSICQLVADVGVEFEAELGGGCEPGGGEVGVVEVGEGFGVHEGGFADVGDIR